MNVATGRERSMSNKANYSAEEWKAISAAPVAAGLLITLSDASGPVGIAKEAMAVGKAITDSARGDAPEIVKALAETVKSGGGHRLQDMARVRGREGVAGLEGRRLPRHRRNSGES
jgi:hypothetical protein